MFTPNSKKVVFWIVALYIALCCIPRPQSTMDVTNFYIACQDRKALWSTLLPHECRCLILGTCNAIKKFVTSMVHCGMGMQQCAMHNATIQKTTFFELDLYTLINLFGHESNILCGCCLMSLLCLLCSHTDTGNVHPSPLYGVSGWYKEL